jgi:hypothetical protein
MMRNCHDVIKPEIVLHAGQLGLISDFLAWFQAEVAGRAFRARTESPKARCLK